MRERLGNRGRQSSRAADAGAHLVWLGETPAPASLQTFLATPEPLDAEATKVVFLADTSEPPAALLAYAGDERRCRIVVQPEAEPARAAALLEAGADAVCAYGEVEEPRLLIVRALAAARLRMRLATVSRHTEHLQASIDTVPIPIFFKDVAGVYVGCNKAYLDFLGRPREQVVGKTAPEVMPPDLASVYLESDRRVARNPDRAEIYETSAPFADGTRRDVLFHKAAYRSQSGQVLGIAGAMMDITDRKRLEAQLIEAAEHDPLTGLFNRRKFFELGEEMLQSARAKGKTLCAALVDLDRFKSINDRYGHAAGDFVLRKIAEIAQTHVRRKDILARAGGEEFYTLLPNADEAAAARIANRLRVAIANGEFLFAGKRLKVTASIGVAEIDDDESLEDALARADAALYRAKETGRNRVLSCAAS